MLAIESVTLERAGLPVVREVSLTVDRGQVVVLLGANGAGKTTLLDGISGLVSLAGGHVTLGGRQIARWRPVRRITAGLGYVEAGRTAFGTLTTEENLRVAAGPRASIDEAFEIFPELDKLRGSRAAVLSGGEQQMLVLSRALLRHPSILLLDELSLGLAPTVVSRIMAAIRTLADRGTGILLVEQFAHMALAIGDRAYVMRTGGLVYSGDAATLYTDPGRLHELYLGEARTEVTV